MTGGFNVCNKWNESRKWLNQTKLPNKDTHQGRVCVTCDTHIIGTEKAVKIGKDAIKN